MTTIAQSLHDQTVATAAAARRLAAASTEVKNAALIAIAEQIESNSASILRANEQDLDAAKRDGLSFHMLDRMTLNEARVKGMADAARNIASLDDPIGEILEHRELPNGLDLEQVRVPLGVIGVIYESRPNVTIDIATLCLKSGNAAILRGGSEAINANQAIAECLRIGLREAGLPDTAVVDAIAEEVRTATMSAIAAAVTAGMEAVRGELKPGLRVAVAVGSRGIANLSEIVGAVIGQLKDAGCEPYIVPAMGSHGGMIHS